MLRNRIIQTRTSGIVLILTALAVLLSACGNETPWSGTKQIGVSGHNTWGRAVATDSSWNVLLSGYTDGNLDGNTLTGSNDFIVTRYNRSGVKLSTKQLGVTGAYTYGLAVAVDSRDNVYVVGNTYGDLDGNTRTGTTDFFVTQYDRSGVKQYTRQLGASGQSTAAYAVAIDPNDNLYIAGTTAGDLDGNTLTGSNDFFLTKYNSSGVKQYTRQLGVSLKATFAYGVATDGSGNVFVAGYTNGGLDGNTLTGNWDCFITKYDSSGTKQYTRQLGVSGKVTYVRGVATDASGNVYIAGYTNGDLDGNTLTGLYDFFVTRYSSSGTKQYTRQLGVSGSSTQGYAVATDGSGNVYVTGNTDGGLDGNTPTGTQDFFVTKFNSSGVKQYTRQIGASGQVTYGQAVATDGAGNVFVVGYTDGGLDGNTLIGTQDGFVTKFNSSGMKQ